MPAAGASVGDVERRWWVVVPMKRTDRAKSRLGGPHGRRRQLAILMARDTLCAAVNATNVAGVLVVCQQEADVESFSLPGVRVVVRPGLDLNQAVRAGQEMLRAVHLDADVAVLPGDLPYLRSSELETTLRRAGEVPRAVVGDREATGTTLLTARGGVDLDPAYGADSLSRHLASGAVRLDPPTWSGLRRDVDLADDLVVNVALGRRTRQLMDRLGPRGVLA